MLRSRPCPYYLALALALALSGNPTPQHLEVTSLWVVGGVGVIAAGSGAIENLEALLVAVSGLADEVLEGLGGDEAGARTGHEKTPWGHQLHGEDVEVVVLL